MTLTYISGQLNTHEKCIKYLEKKRWNDVPVCPYCKSEKCSKKKLRYTCLGCSNSFSVTVGTFLENTNLPLYKWLMAISIMLAAKKGVSAMQLSRDLSVNKNTAWLLQMKIRAAMNDGKLEPFRAKSSKKVHQNSKTGSSQNAEKKNEKEYNGRFKKHDAFRYWSLFKRAIIGQYHKIEAHHVLRYTDEIDFKYCRKHLNDRGYSELLNRLLFDGVAK